MTEASPITTTPKKRGRPKGSKNKANVNKVNVTPTATTEQTTYVQTTDVQTTDVDNVTEIDQSNAEQSNLVNEYTRDHYVNLRYHIVPEVTFVDHHLGRNSHKQGDLTTKFIGTSHVQYCNSTFTDTIICSNVCDRLMYAREMLEHMPNIRIMDTPIIAEHYPELMPHIENDDTNRVMFHVSPNDIIVPLDVYHNTCENTNTIPRDVIQDIFYAVYRVKNIDDTKAQRRAISAYAKYYGDYY